jgi:alkanesulfonate monooxygenase
MKFIIAVHPGIVAPLMLAQKAATFDQFSDGRLILNMVTGENRQMPPYGIELDHDERYALTDEYWSVWRRLMSGETVDFQGKYMNLRGAQLRLPPLQKPYPPLFFGGSSEPALSVAARHADTYLTWGEPPPLAAEKIASVRERAKGRKVKFGIRLNVIVRETKQEAWDAAQWLLDRMDDSVVAGAQARNQASDSVGQQRMREIVGSQKPKHARDLEIYPDLWAGFGLVRNGPGTAIVGDPETVAARILEYRDIGFDTFIISGQPLLEETYRVADLLLPLLPFDRGHRRENQHAIGPYFNAARG